MVVKGRLHLTLANVGKSLCLVLYHFSSDSSSIQQEWEGQLHHGHHTLGRNSARFRSAWF
jgi:NADH:ubiquinone oxidoreductase subunit